MSLPTFPDNCPPIKQEDALNMILTSIAMEEVGLSHIINAEGEKLQYAIKHLKCGKQDNKSMDKLLEVNESVKCTLDAVMNNQVLLKSKMESVLCHIKKNTTYSCNNKCICISSFKNHDGMIWNEKGLLKLRTACPRPCLCLSSDCNKIVLRGGRCYNLDFSADLLPIENNGNSVSIAIQIKRKNKIENVFVYNKPILSEKNSISVSLGGISISTCGDPSCVELMFRLLSPSSINVRKAFVTLIEH